MTKTLPMLLAGASLLAGCNLAPKYVRPAGAIPATVPQGAPYPVLGTEAADVTAIAWRDFFIDPALREVIGQGLENNRDLRLAAANVLQARAQYRIRRADQVPTTAVSAGVVYTNNIGAFAGQGTGATGTGGTGTGGTGTGTGGVGTGTGGTGTGVGTGTTAGAGTTSSNIEIYTANIGFSAFEIDLFGRLRNLSRAAQEQFFATEEAQRATRVSLIAEIATAYVTLASDQDQLAISRDVLESFRQSVELTRAQFRIGTSSELEVRQADTNFQQARGDIAALETRIAQDKNALDLLVGAPVAPQLLPRGLGAGQPTLPDLPADLSSDVLLRRPDVLQAERQLRAQNANIGAARAAMFPTISLTATLGTISTALSGLFDAGSDTFTLAPQAALPLFDGGRRRGGVRLAEAQQLAAVATYERTLQVAFREVADALATRGTITEQVAARTARADSANAAARLSDARYRAGVDSFLGTLDSQRTAYAARQDLVTIRLERASNLVALYRSLGGGLN